MPTRSHRRTEVTTVEEGEIVPDGWAARAADRLLENPAMSGGLFVMALTATAIISNAMVLQSVRHPDPLFMTRPAPAAEADPVPVPRPRADQVGAIPPVAAAEPPLPRPPPAARQAEASSSRTDRTLITELQRALAARGLYSGAIDGISGSRTRRAITAYQRAAGLAVTGVPNASVLDHITTASLAPPPKAPAAPAVAPPEPRREKLVVPVSARPAPAEAVPAAPAVMQPMPPPVAGFVPPAAIPVPQNAAQQAIEAKIDAEIAARDRYLTVQRALNRAGYGPVPENGEESAETAEAIRRFELDNGLPITGAPEDHVVDRLVAIGALAAT